MRCDCPECGAYMAHATDLTMGCVCPWCNARCTACLGTNTVMSREDLAQMAEQMDRFMNTDPSQDK